MSNDCIKPLLLIFQSRHYTEFHIDNDFDIRFRIEYSVNMLCVAIKKTEKSRLVMKVQA